MTFEHEGKTYEIAYSIGRVRLYEREHDPIIKTVAEHNGILSVEDLLALSAYGLREEGGEWANPGEASAIAEKLLVDGGYMGLQSAVMQAIRRDCGFFFQAMKQAR